MEQDFYLVRSFLVYNLMKEVCMDAHVDENIGFSDSEFQSVLIENDDLTLVVKLWNEKKVSIVFKNVIGVKQLMISDIDGFFIMEKQSSLMKAALENYYEVIPEPHGFKEYYLRTVDGKEGFNVVSEEIIINI